MVDKKIDDKETAKVINNLFLDKRKEFMNNTQLNVEGLSCNVIGEQSISPEQTNKFI